MEDDFDDSDAYETTHVQGERRKTIQKFIRGEDGQPDIIIRKILVEEEPKPVKKKKVVVIEETTTVRRKRGGGGRDPRGWRPRPRWGSRSPPPQESNRLTPGRGSKEAPPQRRRGSYYNNSDRFNPRAGYGRSPDGASSHRGPRRASLRAEDFERRASGRGLSRARSSRGFSRY